MWIEPSAFRPEAGQVVSVKLRVGQELLGDPIPRSSQLMQEFVVADAAGRKAVPGREGRDPAGFVQVRGAGVSVIGYSSKANAAELPAEKFNSYLKEEGLESVLAERARRKQGGEKGREQFFRCAKSLLMTGPADPKAGDRELGFPLELTAERNPYAAGGEDALPVRLTYGNRPVANVLVIARNRTRPGDAVTARTGKDGRVRMKLPGGGMWMLKAVHMVPAPAGTEADWTSYWASLTFDRGSK